MAGTRRGQGHGGSRRLTWTHAHNSAYAHASLPAPLDALPLHDLLSPRSHLASTSPQSSRPYPLPVCVRALRFNNGCGRREQGMAGTVREAVMLTHAHHAARSLIRRREQGMAGTIRHAVIVDGRSSRLSITANRLCQVRSKDKSRIIKTIASSRRHPILTPKVTLTPDTTCEAGSCAKLPRNFHDNVWTTMDERLHQTCQQYMEERRDMAETMATMVCCGVSRRSMVR
ncbi:hypothetical protein MUK42_20544 [Musa troglodytarum]|uniref:Uncharacterized protein n=1 Tax=Musa troglodytarum TaxID=320322 RepID=A0A9E7K2M4_9LILI|nr:hypothetical protein MUK42_20544 [Musa troglodytarum]